MKTTRKAYDYEAELINTNSLETRIANLIADANVWTSLNQFSYSDGIYTDKVSSYTANDASWVLDLRNGIFDPKVPERGWKMDLENGSITKDASVQGWNLDLKTGKFSKQTQGGLTNESDISHIGMLKTLKSTDASSYKLFSLKYTNEEILDPTKNNLNAIFDNKEIGSLQLVYDIFFSTAGISLENFKTNPQPYTGNLKIEHGKEYLLEVEGKYSFEEEISTNNPGTTFISRTRMESGSPSSIYLGMDGDSQDNFYVGYINAGLAIEETTVHGYTNKTIKISGNAFKLGGKLNTAGSSNLLVNYLSGKNVTIQRISVIYSSAWA